jgi:hypothetical protein
VKKLLCRISLVLLLCFSIICQDKTEKAELEKMNAMNQMEEQNKAVARQLHEALDAQDINRFNELLAPDHVRTGRDLPSFGF